MDFDLIIVGAGIAGLWSGIQALRKGKKHLRVLILEKYKYIGGRIVTHYKKGNQWEIGAGRIHISHTRVRGLMKKFGLTWVPMSDESAWRDSDKRIQEPDIFEELAHIYISPLMFLPEKELRSKTIYECLINVHGKEKTEELLKRFPYYSEVRTIRADLGLKSFQEEMSGWGGFGGCREGLTAIIRELTAEFEALGGRIFYKDPAVDVRKKRDCIEVVLDDDKILTCKSCLLATHRDAIASMPSLKSWPLLDLVKMDPLLRMYAVFPVHSGKSWFSDIPKTITDEHLRFIIPVNPSKGVLMISYTDGKDAQYWIDRVKKRGREAVQREVLEEIRKLFPEKRVPDPKEFHMYPWHSGCTFWLPGVYDPVEESKRAHVIDEEGIFCCGESFSLRQAWMEGALEHAEGLFEVKSFLKSIS
jgi:monoamine oxidase